MARIITITITITMGAKVVQKAEENLSDYKYILKFVTWFKSETKKSVNFGNSILLAIF